MEQVDLAGADAIHFLHRSFADRFKGAVGYDSGPTAEVRVPLPAPWAWA